MEFASQGSLLKYIGGRFGCSPGCNNGIFQLNCNPDTTDQTAIRKNCSFRTNIINKNEESNNKTNQKINNFDTSKNDQSKINHSTTRTEGVQSKINHSTTRTEDVQSKVNHLATRTEGIKSKVNHLATRTEGVQSKILKNCDMAIHDENKKNMNCGQKSCRVSFRNTLTVNSAPSANSSRDPASGLFNNENADCDPNHIIKPNPKLRQCGRLNVTFDLGASQKHQDTTNSEQKEEIKHNNLAISQRKSGKLIHDQNANMISNDHHLHQSYNGNGFHQQLIINSSSLIQSNQILAKIFKQIVQAVAYLHNEVKVVHRDIKPENILLTKNLDAILIDFGMSKRCPKNDENLLSTRCGSPLYVAPEVITADRQSKDYYDEKSDVWSLGVILYLLTTGTHPFFDENIQTLLSKIVNQSLTFPDEKVVRIPAILKDLIMKMLEKDPQQRLSAKQVLFHEWMKLQATLCKMSMSVPILSNRESVGTIRRGPKSGLMGIRKGVSRLGNAISSSGIKPKIVSPFKAVETFL
ncbi:hypothetical protein TRFO_16294 [Tritrichomonas foetus]|uniref:Protein kinase domain-containing protein n=1 Tax=Tritrichomonas foetus TaxID=1144522 RepID=A0A1J4KUU6_9EUKA|nr:hypothetical protein TRFO_16294 [Tritrichomonas foetus]|eukprot:OHT13446.1 hypothetical protein TRFO_16294 [Tritrichomonas foetus]